MPSFAECQAPATQTCPCHCQSGRVGGTQDPAMTVAISQATHVAQPCMGSAGPLCSGRMHSGSHWPGTRPRASPGKPHHILSRVHPSPGLLPPLAAGADPAPHHDTTPRPASCPRQAAFTCHLRQAGRRLLWNVPPPPPRKTHPHTDSLYLPIFVALHLVLSGLLLPRIPWMCFSDSSGPKGPYLQLASRGIPQPCRSRVSDDHDSCC